MYGSEFDGSAAFSGGGFMPSQATQAPDPSFSTSKVLSFVFSSNFKHLFGSRENGPNYYNASNVS